MDGYSRLGDRSHARSRCSSGRIQRLAGRPRSDDPEPGSKHDPRRGRPDPLQPQRVAGHTGGRKDLLCRPGRMLLVVYAESDVPELRLAALSHRREPHRKAVVAAITRATGAVQRVELATWGRTSTTRPVCSCRATSADRCLHGPWGGCSGAYPARTDRDGSLICCRRRR